uniref:Uncharacterized protein n=1 Tax=Arundo donax TaxID=35708 RepID=A0A0A9C9V7_ARUDO
MYPGNFVLRIRNHNSVPKLGISLE